ncbi:MAG: glycosyl transferase [Bacteroidetes bacterium]|nr:glycosyl transferase [Bacteroidota bacterium]
MKVLYAIQGTGNGHISRALEILPLLKKRAEVDVLVSASQWELTLPFEVKYRYHGLGFVFGKKGGVDILRTYLKLDTLKLFNEIKRLPVEDYDLVISDFEPVSSWACQLKRKTCIGLSNQVATLHPLAPMPETKDRLGKMVLEHYAPSTASYGFHFKRYDQDIYTPIIRNAVRRADIKNKEHFTVYLPSYEDQRVLKNLMNYKGLSFQLFSKKAKSAYRVKNTWVLPLHNDSFIKSMAESEGVITNAGFGTTSEALYLGKRLLVIPMKTQFEQHCNASTLESMGVTVMKSLKEKHMDKLEDWFNKKTIVPVDYPDETGELLDKIIHRHAGQQPSNEDFESQLKFLRKLIRTNEIAA